MEWYEPEVRALEAGFKGWPAEPHPPVIYGSSSIRLWDTVQEDLGPSVLNLGFGGSTLEACAYFFDRLVPPVSPRSLLVYAGDNDLGDGRRPEHVLNSFRRLASSVETELGSIPFGFISIKLSPVRRALVSEIRRANDLIRTQLATIPNAYFVDVFDAMLDSKGEPRLELFDADGLHLSRSGYSLWAQLLRPYHNQIFIQKPLNLNITPVQ